MPEYICGQCGTPLEVPDTAITFNARKPGTFELIMELTPYFMLCGNCGQPLPAPFPSLYIDPDRQFTVRFTPSGSSVPLYGGPLDYTLRDTDLLLDFREKVLLLTHGLDDLGLELMKMKTMEANRESNFVDVICMQVFEDHLHMRGLVFGGRDILFNTPIELYERAHKSVPDKWRPHGFAKVDQEYIDNLINPVDPYRITDFTPAED